MKASPSAARAASQRSQAGFSSSATTEAYAQPEATIGAMEVRWQARGGPLILGGGVAGAYVARLLGRRGATIVSPENFMLYTPILPEAASGTLEPRHVVVPIRQMCRHADLLLGRATAVDLAARRVTVEVADGSFTVRYRQLV